MSLYADVFTEAVRAASIIPSLSSETTFFAMHGFGTFDMPLAAGCAIAGATLGGMFNWLIGDIFKTLYLKRKAHHVLSKEKYDRAQRFFKRYGIVWLLVCWLPLLNFTVLAAGFLGIRWRIALPLILLGQTGYYGLYLFH